VRGAQGNILKKQIEQEIEKLLYMLKVKPSKPGGQSQILGYVLTGVQRKRLVKSLYPLITSPDLNIESIIKCVQEGNAENKTALEEIQVTHLLQQLKAIQKTKVNAYPATGTTDESPLSPLNSRLPAAAPKTSPAASSPIASSSSKTSRSRPGDILKAEIEKLLDMFIVRPEESGDPSQTLIEKLAGEESNKLVRSLYTLIMGKDLDRDGIIKFVEERSTANKISLEEIQFTHFRQIEEIQKAKMSARPVEAATPELPLPLSGPSHLLLTIPQEPLLILLEAELTTTGTATFSTQRDNCA
jgi:hypothetical protein